MGRVPVHLPFAMPLMVPPPSYTHGWVLPALVFSESVNPPTAIIGSPVTVKAEPAAGMPAASLALAMVVSSADQT